MRIAIENSQKVATGLKPKMIHDEEGIAHLFYVRPGEDTRVVYASANVNLGLWNSLSFGEPIVVSEMGVIEDVFYMPDRTTVFLELFTAPAYFKGGGVDRIVWNGIDISNIILKDIF